MTTKATKWIRQTLHDSEPIFAGWWDWRGAVYCFVRGHHDVDYDQCMCPEHNLCYGCGQVFPHKRGNIVHRTRWWQA